MTASTTVRKRLRATGAVATSSVSSDIRSGGRRVDGVESVAKHEVPLTETINPAYVKVGGGITKNLGDFNSLRVSVEVSMPCAPTEEGITECYRSTSELVASLMDAEFEAQQAKALGVDG